MGNISFFAKHSKLLSSKIRGRQIAEYIGGRFNPQSDYENDVCIYIKPDNLDNIKDGDYVDFSDGIYLRLLEQLKLRPKVNVIAHTIVSSQYLRQRIPNEIFVIEQQHLNWDREKRTRKGLLRGGYIGKQSSVADAVNRKIVKTLYQLNISFYECYHWPKRIDAINFYKEIDFLVIGPHKSIKQDDYFITPTKMINAASFGIPSIASWRVGYDGFNGYYSEYENSDELYCIVKELQNVNYYNRVAGTIMRKAEEYHISKVAEKYKRLK